MIPEDETRINVAAALLFTTTPTDRALTGWCGPEWAWTELEALGISQMQAESAAGEAA